MVTEGKNRVRKSPEERKAEIIAAAGKLIGEKGYYGTSLKDIADAIGMSQPGLLHYIGNKERLLSLLVTRDAHIVGILRLSDVLTTIGRMLDAVDTQAAWTTALAHTKPADWAEDGSHPSAPGHAVIALAFLRTIGFSV